MSDALEDKQPRRKVVRDVLIFQVKLWLEGFKDIILMPLSLGAAAVDLFFRKRPGRGVLYSVMKLGDRFEQWVHLYAALEDSEDERREVQAEPRSLDDLLNEAADGVEQNVSNGEVGPTGTDRPQSQQ